MTDEERKAAHETMNLRRNMSHSMRCAFDGASLKGHALVSQGAGLFRCVKCDACGYAYDLEAAKCPGVKP